MKNMGDSSDLYLYPMKSLTKCATWIHGWSGNPRNLHWSEVIHVNLQYTLFCKQHKILAEAQSCLTFAFFYRLICCLLVACWLSGYVGETKFTCFTFRTKYVSESIVVLMCPFFALFTFFIFGFFPFVFVYFVFCMLGKSTCGWAVA